MEYRKLTPEEEHIIVGKGTERPFSGKYDQFYEKGTYICKRCSAPLFRSSDKFDAGCGWPAFDDDISGAVIQAPDSDGRRTEITCAQCGAHLGHVFSGERFTKKNLRHCVNSLSLLFIPDEQKISTLEKAYFASGCFWGTEFYFSKAAGVVETTVGFMGGHREQPTYKEVCTQTTGHLETVEVVYNTEQTCYENLVELFFEIHDFTQTDGQGPDIGPQYLSAIFYTSSQQECIARRYVEILTKKGYAVATRISPASRFWPAESYHQDYYDLKGTTPYCHIRKHIF